MKIYLSKTLLLLALITTYCIAVSCSETEEIEIFAPVLNDYNVDVAENIAAGSQILTFSATDEDTELSGLTYTITQNPNNLFLLSMSGNNAVITLADGEALDFETSTSHDILVEVSDGENTTSATITVTVTDIEDTASATAATFGSYVTQTGTYYDLSNRVEIVVTGYNENYTYELKLKGIYYNNEYTITLSEQETEKKSSEEISVKYKTNLLSPVGGALTTGVVLEADADDVNLEADEYTIVLLEKESNQEITITGNISEYTVVDKNGNNFLSGTQVESDSWSVLSELNLSNHSTFRVRPTITNYINGIGVVLGVYNLNAEKIGYITSNGSNGSSAGTYSYRFNASSLNDLITADGEYLLRLEERTSTVDADNTGTKIGMFQKINITKITSSEDVSLSK